MARFGLKIRLPTQANPFAQPFLPVATGDLVEPRSAKRLRFMLMCEAFRKNVGLLSTNDATRQTRILAE